MRFAHRLLLAFVTVACLAGCGARSDLPAPRTNEGSDGGSSVPCATGDGLSLAGRVRDFSMQHPDFEKFIGDDRGIVEPELAADGTPVYAGNPTTPTTTGKVDFDQWYHDTPGVNQGADIALPLAGDLGAFAFDSDAFFPIDGMLLGNEGHDHNFSFTLELHGQFRYQGGETFEVAGDDDLWLFVDGHLAVDLGGVHSAEDGSVAVDDLAGELGLVQNGVYAIDVFFAERHTDMSELHVNLTGPDLCVLAE